MKNTAFPLRGTSLMVATIIGGGMFALPIAFAHVWFLQGMLVLSLVGALMLITGLILVDINMRFPHGASFHTFTRTLIGPATSVFIGVALCFVLYLLTYAYISGAASIFRGVFHASSGKTDWITIPALTLTTALILLVGGRLPGYILSILIAAKFTIFLALFSGITSQVNPQMLEVWTTGNSLQQYMLIIPVCIVSFGFHGSVPSLTRMYSQDNHRAITRSLVLGVVISLLIYAFWLTITMGSMDQSSIMAVQDKGGNIGAFIAAMNLQKTGSVILVYFGIFAILASLMSASIGLCDYLDDTLRKRCGKASRPLAIALTYFPPAVVCMLEPEGFLPALAFAGLSLVIWSILLPPTLLLRARKSSLTPVYSFPGNNLLLKLIIGVGAVIWLMMIYFLFTQ